MKLRFTKMQGAGNDFVVLDGVSQHLADRHFGVGCDQILLVSRRAWPASAEACWMRAYAYPPAAAI